MPKASLPFSSLADRAFGSNEEIAVKDIRLGSFYLTPELRWYTGGGYGHGFYLMAYYRYQRFDISGYTMHLDLHSSSAGARDRQVDVALAGKLSTNSFGFGFGAQWLLGRNKNIVLDWNILGVHLGSGKFDLTGDIAQGGLTPSEIQDLRHQVAENVSDLPLVKLGGEDVQVDQQAVAIKDIRSPWGFLRSSLSIGFRF